MNKHDKLISVSITLILLSILVWTLNISLAAAEDYFKYSSQQLKVNLSLISPNLKPLFPQHFGGCTCPSCLSR